VAKKFCGKCGESQPLDVTSCACGGTSFDYINDNSESTYSAESSKRNLDSREGGFRVSTATFGADEFPIVTSNYVPGKEVAEVVGLIFCSSNRMLGLTVTNLASNTFKDAYQDIELKARQMGADGVISLVIAAERGGPSALMFSQTMTLMGTAVKFNK